MRLCSSLVGNLYGLSCLFHTTFATSGVNAGQNAICASEPKERTFILTDIGNEPDDTMSMVRLLVHSDLYDIEGIVAITSFWLPNATNPDMLHDLVDAYELVRENLQSHSNSSFPTAKYLHSKIASGPDVYGKQALRALEQGKNATAGIQMLIDAVDASDLPLYVQIWGGANTLASALWTVNRTRSGSERDAFVSKLRVYSISDQDDTGPWIRRNFPNLRYIASRHGFNQYPVAAWSGMSSPSVDPGGPDNDIVSQEWLTANIQIGSLGKKYPDVVYIMEGDTPALLYHIPNGLGDPEHPEWGSWGGRYVSNPLDDSVQYSDAVDAVEGQNGELFRTNHATIWRWRDAFQDEFAARMQWTLGANSTKPTTHPPIVNVNGSCAPKALQLNVQAGENITLDASATYSPDLNARLNFTWFQYFEPSSFQSASDTVPVVNITTETESNSSIAYFRVPHGQDSRCVAADQVTEYGAWGELSKCPVLHLVLAVKDVGAVHPITRYKRVVLHVQPYDLD
ncbi:cellulose-binding protein [Stemphylium lycopersici]|uniref:Cellulose-binding protein n=1 Tax=Stemphylium lycopersici TaxID=183478 RepID=A0A364N647_STELY|nr:cellulose-binding protein [Stemphylium lycopersici]RAR00518.1 cellulose-binding protein [Stemphylium lycopersici]RAR12712.1 cellulose-binding protein [Stemphylium lycopersici]